MLMVVQANGATLQLNMTMADFQTAMAAAAPSPWISVIEMTLGQIMLNIYVIVYYYEIQ